GVDHTACHGIAQTIQRRLLNAVGAVGIGDDVKSLEIARTAGRKCHGANVRDGGQVASNDRGKVGGKGGENACRGIENTKTRVDDGVKLFVGCTADAGDIRQAVGDGSRARYIQAASSDVDDTG